VDSGLSYMPCSECGARMRRAKTSAKLGPSICRPCRVTVAEARTCARCGRSGVRSNAEFCSRQCGVDNRRTRWPQCAVPIDHPARKAWPERGPATRVFITDCGICATTFVSVYTTSTCSTPCAEIKRVADRREHKHRRRARKRGAFVAPVSARQIHERDKWRCHICRKLVSKTAVVPHPRAATLDHLVPLAALGTHEPANVATAHFICNSTKGDRGGGEQLMLVG
jgi:hypothetical protein